MVKWFYYSQIRGRYISQLPQKLDRDLRTIKESTQPFDELLAVIAEERPLEVTPNEFEGRSISHPLYPMIRWLFKSREAYCFTTGVKLRQPMGKRYALENDHIFPFSKLKAAGYGPENRLKYSLAQELTNRAVLTLVANRTKSATDAQSYLSEIKARNPDALDRQCVPEDEDLWGTEHYEEFLKARRELLARELNAFLASITATKSSKAPISLAEMIAEGESEELEFKQTLRWDIKEGRVNKGLEDVVLKTIAAFGNSFGGGTLLLGVSDRGEATGLDHDYVALGDADKDRFELHLRNLVNREIGEGFCAAKMKVSFPIVNEIEICRVDIKRADIPIIIEQADKNGVKQQKFYARSGNSSPELPLAEVPAYLKQRFG